MPRYFMDRMIRCPYCAEAGNFRIMTLISQGIYRCLRCQHEAMPAVPEFLCSCMNCMQSRRAATKAYG